MLDIESDVMLERDRFRESGFFRLISEGVFGRVGGGGRGRGGEGAARINWNSFEDLEGDVRHH